jgi:group I intron endonuclease
MNVYSSFIAKSRYCRFVQEANRREHWNETVARYFNYMEKHLKKNHDYTLTKELRKELEDSVVSLEVMPSMRALMTAGPALERDNVAGYNCAYLAVDDVKAFDESMYILLCFHPETLVQCRGGNKKIIDIKVGDEVVSFNEVTQTFEYKTVTNQIKTPSAQRSKVSVELDNGTVVRCTADHKWLTSNRGYVEAQHLTVEDDLVAPAYEVYKHTNRNTGKCYVGYTSKGTAFRFKQHIASANSTAGSGYNSYFYKSMRKHGVGVWGTEVLDFAYSHEEAQEKEMAWIFEEDSYRNGYNSTIGGEGGNGIKWSDEARKSASENAYERTPEIRAMLGETIKSNMTKLMAARHTPENLERDRINNLGEKNPMFGKKKTVEQIEHLRKISLGEGNPFYGKRHTEETKQRISAVKSEQAKNTPNPFLGKTHTEETKQKMRDCWARRRKQKAMNEELEAA